MIDFDKIKKNAKFLPGDAFDKYWNEFNNSGIKAKKLEFLQTYEFIDGNEDFNNKNYDGFLKFLKVFSENAYGGKDNIKRIHFIEEPINNYLKMEYYTYLINEKYGQEIKITKDRDFFPKKVYDFVLFENSNLFLLDFGNNDCWKGVWHITDKKLVLKVSDWYDEVFEKSINFKTMIKPNSYLIKKMKEYKII